MSDFGECDECGFEWFPNVPSEEIHADGCSRGKKGDARRAHEDEGIQENENA